MNSVMSFILTSVAMGAGIYALLAVGLTAFGKRRAVPTGDVHFDALLALDTSGLPELQHYTTRDGAALPYRHYPADTDDVLILLHGSGYHSRYLLPLARFISENNFAQVVTPDLRGHGERPQIRGDIAYIRQYEDDLADLIAHIRQTNPAGRILMGGHSSGGGLALRFAGSQYGDEIAAYLLLAPYIAYNAPTIRPDAGWATVHTGRIIGLTMLNNVGVRVFNDLPVIDFQMPESARDGSETLQYSFRLNTGYAPENYKKALASIQQPFLLLVGAEDELFYAAQYAPLLAEYTQADVVVIDGLAHMDIAVSDQTHRFLREWFATLG